MRPLEDRDKVPQPTRPCFPSSARHPLSSCTHHLPNGRIGMVGGCGDELQGPCRRRTGSAGRAAASHILTRELTLELRQLPLVGGTVLALGLSQGVPALPQARPRERVRLVALQTSPICWRPAGANAVWEPPLSCRFLLVDPIAGA